MGVLLLPAALGWAIPIETGLPPVEHFRGRDYGGSADNRNLAISDLGLVYLANSSGLFEYDGVRWQPLGFAGANMVGDMLVDGNRLWVAGSDAIGIVEPDDLGIPRFRDLLSEAPETIRGQRFWTQMQRSEDAVLVQSEHNLAMIDGKERVRGWTFEAGVGGAFVLRGSLYVSLYDNSLLRLDPGEEQFISLPPPPEEWIALRSARNFGDGRIAQVNVNNEVGWFDGETFRPLPLDLRDDAGEEPEFVSLAVLPEHGLLALGTVRSGLYIIDEEGHLRAHFTTREGLPEDSVHRIVPDPAGGLWLVQDKGITRLEYPGPVVYYNEYSGLPGPGTAVVRHQGRIYTATTSGLFRLTEQPLPGQP
ncbi:MAG: hypothetical protein EA425_13580, partial [Puniceicoccaceae bacterium]